MADDCASGLCGADVPPLIGSTLTGAGMTLDQAVARLLAGDPLPAPTDVQRRMVEERAALLDDRADATSALRSSSSAAGGR